jgi:hypothetical protein
MHVHFALLLFLQLSAACAFVRVKYIPPTAVHIFGINPLIPDSAISSQFSIQRLICPEFFDIAVLNRNVDSLRTLHGSTIINHYEEYLLDKVPRMTRLDYLHHNIHHTCVLDPYVFHSLDEPAVEKVQYNMKMNEMGYLYSDPAMIGTVKCVLPNSRRHRCTGWCMMDPEIFRRLPAFVGLAEMLLGAGNIVASQLFYNRAHEMIEAKLRDKHGTNIVITIDRWGGEEHGPSEEEDP